MFRQRRSFSAKFKSDLVIELLKGEKDLNTLAAEITSSQTCCGTGKKSSLTMLPLCSMTSVRKISKKTCRRMERKSGVCQESRSVNHAGGLDQKNLKKFADLTTRVNLVQNLLTTKELPASVGARLLGINRTSIYYKGTPVSEEELVCKEIIDHLHTDNPTWGARQMSA